MNVTEAVNSRRSVRSYQDKPVDPAILRRVLETAQRSPSGGNTQPWNAVILTGQPLADLTAKIKAKATKAKQAQMQLDAQSSQAEMQLKTQEAQANLALQAWQRPGLGLLAPGGAFRSWMQTR